VLRKKNGKGDSDPLSPEAQHLSDTRRKPEKGWTIIGEVEQFWWRKQTLRQERPFLKANGGEYFALIRGGV